MKKSVIAIIMVLNIILPAMAQNNEKKNKIEGDIYRNEKLGVEVKIPEGEWYLEDKSVGPSGVIIISNSSWKDFQFKIVIMPATLGMNTADDLHSVLPLRLGNMYRMIEMGKGRLFNVETTTLTCELTDSSGVKRSMIHVLVIGDNAYQVHVSSPKNDWDNRREMLLGMFDRISLIEKKEEKFELVSNIEESEPPDTLSGAIKITHHDLKLDIYPVTGAFRCYDRITMIIQKTRPEYAEFKLSEMHIDSIRIDGKKCNYSLDDFRGYTTVKKLVVSLPADADSGDVVTMEYYGHEKKYFFEAQVAQISTYNILGQINEKSSYSSLVWYYPLDEENDASGEIRIIVPKGYTAVSEGKLVSKKSMDGRVEHHFQTFIPIPRTMPFAFAVGQYEKYAITETNGAPVEMYTWKSDEEHALKRMKVVRDIIDFYEEIYGSFPLEKISIIHVTPEKGISGQALPTMVFLSDAFFQSKCSYDIISESITQSYMSILILADEIAHQWNAYKVYFPGAMAEGMSQYSDALFAEHISGKEVLRMHIEYLSSLYKTSIKKNPDVPIASSLITRSRAYHGIAFCKGALVLNMLRYIVGDDNFFNGVRHIFTKYAGQKADYGDLQKSMEEFHGGSLEWFFEQWYHWAGYPTYDVKIENVKQKDGKHMTSVTIEQTQEGKAYRMPIDVTFIFETGEKTFPGVVVDEKIFKKTFELDETPTQVIIDKKGMLLKDVIYD